MTLANNPSNVKHVHRQTHPQFPWDKCPTSIDALLDDVDVKAFRRDTRYITPLAYWLVEGDVSEAACYSFFQVWLNLTQTSPFMGLVRREVSRVEHMLAEGKITKRKRAKVAPDIDVLTRQQQKVYNHLFLRHQARGNFEWFEVSLSLLRSQLHGIDPRTIRRVINLLEQKLYIEKRPGSAVTHALTAYRFLTHLERTQALNGR